jgi:NTE family protein
MKKILLCRALSFPVIFFLSTILFIFQFSPSYSQANFDTAYKKILVVSGGGARGAWGVGVVSELFKQHGGYRAVFGTSTGSLMAPFILLQKFDDLENVYSNVTQKDIFSNSPFCVKCHCKDSSVSVKFRAFHVILRVLFGSKTLGVSNNLLNLIRNKLTMNDYNLLIDYFHQYQAMLAVAVTNTRTGQLQIQTDTAYSKSPDDYKKMTNWIWASANEPLLMSYVPMDSSYYVDGGVREVIPIQDALEYAIAHRGIDTVEVIVNNSKIPASQNYKIDSGGAFNGLQRLLSMYDMGTVSYNQKYASLLERYFNATGGLPHGRDSSTETGSRKIHLTIHYMPDSTAAKFSNDLGFCQCSMAEMIRLGKLYAQTPEKPSRVEKDFDSNTVHEFAKKD